MNGIRSRVFSVLGLGVLALAAATGCKGSGGSELVALPELGEWKGEPQVADKIREALAAEEAEPSSADAVGGVGVILHAHEVCDEAIVRYRRAHELAPEEFRWPYLTASCLRESDPEAAVESYETAGSLRQDYLPLYVNLGDTLAQLGQAERAAESYLQALEVDEKSSFALLGLARLALADDKLEQARERLEQAAKVAAWHGEVHTLLAQVYERLGLEEQARMEALRAGVRREGMGLSDPLLASVDSKAVDSGSHQRRGHLLTVRSDFVRAEQEFRRVLEIRPGTVDDFVNLGRALAGQGKLDEAVEQYRKALKIAPDDTNGLKHLAMALSQKDDFDGAVKQLERALAIDPNDAETHANLGLVHTRKGDASSALEPFRQALALDPSRSGTENDLGTALASMGSIDEAMEHWRRAVEINAYELSALYNLSFGLVKRGDHAQAIRWLRAGAETAPNSSMIGALLAWELATAPDAALRNGDEALEVANRINKFYGNHPKISDVVAAALAEAGRFEEAVGLAEQALEQFRNAEQTQLADEVELRLQGYRQGRPYRQPPAAD